MAQVKAATRKRAARAVATFAALYAATPNHGALVVRATGAPSATCPTALAKLVASVRRMRVTTVAGLPFTAPTGTTAAYAGTNAAGVVVCYNLRGNLNTKGQPHQPKQQWQCLLYAPKGGKPLAALPGVGAGFAAAWVGGK